MTKPNVCVISFPKSGRTWLKLMIGKALCEHHHVDDSEMLDFDRLAASTGIPVTSFLHDGSSLKEAERFDELATSKAEYADSAVVFILRDPRDVMVSLYFQATKRRRAFSGTIEDFIRDPTHGIRKCAAFHRIWAENQHVPRKFLLVSYEDMKRDPAHAVRSVLGLLGMNDISPAAVDSAVSFGDFENMQQLESSGHFDDPILRPGNRDDPDSFKVRRGKVGGYHDYLSDSDCAYMEKVMAEEGGPFHARYLRPPKEAHGV
jgi:hypothetical protein